MLPPASMGVLGHAPGGDMQGGQAQA
jgi:hypothetical protein